MDERELDRIAARLGEAVVDPFRWTEILNAISAATGSFGSVLLDFNAGAHNHPRTPSLADCMDSYVAGGWQLHDELVVRGIALAKHGKAIITDHDVMTTDEMRGSLFLNEFRIPAGVHWIAACPVFVGSGGWSLSVTRSEKEGSFTAADVKILTRFGSHLKETARLSTAVGHHSLVNTVNALDLIRKPAVALDNFGFVLYFNVSASTLFDDDICIRGRRLVLRDDRAATAYQGFLDRMRLMPGTETLPCDPIFVRRRERGAVLLRALPIDGPTRTPFLGARVLLLFSDLAKTNPPCENTLKTAFNLSPAEIRLALLLSDGLSLEEASEQLRLARETVRSQIKRIFSKTDTKRQGELVALLTRMG